MRSNTVIILHANNIDWSQGPLIMYRRFLTTHTSQQLCTLFPNVYGERLLIQLILKVNSNRITQQYLYYMVSNVWLLVSRWPTFLSARI